MKRIISLALLLSLLVCLFGCGNPHSNDDSELDSENGKNTETKTIESTPCIGHPYYGSSAIGYHKIITDTELLYNAVSRANEINKETVAIGIDYVGDDVKIFYAIEAKNADNQAESINGFLHEDILSCTISTYLVLKNQKCALELEGDDGESNTKCQNRYLDEVFADINYYKTFDDLEAFAGSDDFAIIKIHHAHPVNIQSADLLTFELYSDRIGSYIYNAYFNEQKVFSINSCVPLDDELISFIKNNLVYID
jgi:hypothetical protein